MSNLKAFISFFVLFIYLFGFLVCLFIFYTFFQIFTIFLPKGSTRWNWRERTVIRGRKSVEEWWKSGVKVTRSKIIYIYIYRLMDSLIHLDSVVIFSQNSVVLEIMDGLSKYGFHSIITQEGFGHPGSDCF